MTTKNPDQEWADWQAWLGEEPGKPSIIQDVIAMLAARQIWDGFGIMYSAAPNRARENGLFQSWLAGNYRLARAMGIRRQTDIRSDVISLARLLDRVSKVPSVLSRDNYAARTSGWQTREESNRIFDRLVGSGSHIDPEIPKRDLEELLERAKPIRKWVSKEIAHYDPENGRFSAGLTYGDVHGNINLIADLMVKYRNMIMGSSMSRRVTMPPGWTTIFRVEWIPDDEAWNAVQERIDEAERARGW